MHWPKGLISFSSFFSIRHGTYYQPWKVELYSWPRRYLWRFYAPNNPQQCRHKLKTKSQWIIFWKVGRFFKKPCISFVCLQNNMISAIFKNSLILIVKFIISKKAEKLKILHIWRLLSRSVSGFLKLGGK